MKLNLFAYDQEDKFILQNAFDAFKNRAKVQIIDGGIAYQKFLSH